MPIPDQIRIAPRDPFRPKTAPLSACLMQFGAALTKNVGGARKRPELQPLREREAVRLTGNPSPDLTAAYLEQREALARFLRARLGPAADVEDLLQELFLKLQAVEDADVRDPRAYLYRLASNLMMDRWRSRTRAAARDGAWLAAHRGDQTDADDAPSPEAVVAGKQRLAALVAAMERLPVKTRTVFRLHKFEDLSYAQVAERLGISRSSVEKHMMDALRVLTARTGR